MKKYVLLILSILITSSLYVNAEETTPVDNNVARSREKSVVDRLFNDNRNNQYNNNDRRSSKRRYNRRNDNDNRKYDSRRYNDYDNNRNSSDNQRRYHRDND